MPPFLYLRTYILRFLQTLGRYCDHYLSTPLPQQHTITRRIKSTVGDHPGEFDILIYAPPGYDKLAKDERIPLLVNFHGGGYTIGHASDDARFVTSLFKTTQKPFIAVSVSYRLAPEHPFPIGISDCVSALLYLWSPSVAAELHIDVSKTCLSGFSAGGQFCFTSLYMLYSYVSSEERGDGNWGGLEERGRGKGKVVGITSIYAPADWTRSRTQRAESNPLTKPLSRIPGLFFGLFEEAYFVSFSEPQCSRKDELDMAEPLLSPGLAPSNLIKEALPQNICMINCEYDSLLTEGELFRERLKREGKSVGGYVVKGVSHGWDKYPSWFGWFGDRDGKEKRDLAYTFVGECLLKFWQ